MHIPNTVKHSICLLENLLDREELTTALEREDRSNNRLSNLLRPVSEVNPNWFMWVPLCFNAALDIQQTGRVFEGIELLEWTQGSAFSFAAGDTIYDTKSAYEPWSEALKSICYCIEVKMASPSVPGKLPSKDPNKAKDPKNSWPRNPGRVDFKLFVPNSTRSGVVLEKECSMTQDAFVRLLITGKTAGLDLTRQTKPDRIFNAETLDLFHLS
jgi:hypothetical protein